MRDEHAAGGEDAVDAGGGGDEVVDEAGSAIRVVFLCLFVCLFYD